MTLITQDSSSNKVNAIRAVSEIALSSLLFASPSPVPPKTTSKSITYDDQIENDY